MDAVLAADADIASAVDAELALRTRRKYLMADACTVTLKTFVGWRGPSTLAFKSQAGGGQGMGDFSDRALGIQPTGVRKMFDLAGDDVISFGLGEPDFQPPAIAIEAFHQAMLDGKEQVHDDRRIASPAREDCRVLGDVPNGLG